MEFKGTEGKWLKHVTPKHKIGVLIGNRFLQLGTIYEEDCLVASCCKTEEHANALLISKAPEMLEMLKKIVSIESIICMSGAVGEEWKGEAESLNTMMNDVKQLIKEATEL